MRVRGRNRGGMGGVTSKAKFGTAIGVGPRGVVAYSSHYGSVGLGQLWDGLSCYVTAAGREIYTGFKWQCVEYARRWWVEAHGVTFGNVGMAYEIFDLPHFARCSDDAPVTVERCRNGGRGVRPSEGTVLLWHPQGHFAKTGHVAIVTECSDTWVRVAEQNVSDAPWCDAVRTTGRAACRASRHRPRHPRPSPTPRAAHAAVAPSS